MKGAIREYEMMAQVLRQARQSMTRMEDALEAMQSRWVSARAVSRAEGEAFEHWIGKQVSNRAASSSSWTNPKPEAETEHYVLSLATIQIQVHGRCA